MPTSNASAVSELEYQAGRVARLALLVSQCHGGPELVRLEAQYEEAMKDRAAARLVVDRRLGRD